MTGAEIKVGQKAPDFGTAYGALIKELRLPARAIFIVDKTDHVRYVEYVKEMTEHSKYDVALKALKGIL